MGREEMRGEKADCHRRQLFFFFFKATLSRSLEIQPGYCGGRGDVELLGVFLR